jgi:transcription elongation factor
MKIGIVFLFISSVVFSQNNISKTVVVQEIKYEYKIKDLADFVSYVPQINIKNKLVQNKINRDIKKYFLATSQVDKATYTKNILKENKAKTVYEYKKRMDDERLERLKIKLI